MIIAAERDIATGDAFVCLRVIPPVSYVRLEVGEHRPLYIHSPVNKLLGDRPTIPISQLD